MSLKQQLPNAPINPDKSDMVDPRKTKIVQKLKKLSFEDAETEVKILFDKGDKIHLFQLKDKRKVNNQLLNSMNLIENILIE